MNAPSTDPVVQLLETINQTLREFFDVRRKRAENDLAFKNQQDKLAAEFSEKDEPLAKREAELTEALRGLIIPNKLVLLTGKLKSVSTMFGNISFVKKAETVQVVDAKQFEKDARTAGHLNKFGRFTRTWKPFKGKDIADLLERDPKLKRRYFKYLSFDGGMNQLFVQPKEAYLTDHDPNRLTVERVNIGTVDAIWDVPRPVDS